jgi:hypothetical protein
MGRSHPAPSAFDGQKNFRQLPDEVGLHFRREHQVAVALILRGERGEDPAADAEIRGSHVGSFFSAIESECDTAEIGSVHGGASVILLFFVFFLDLALCLAAFEQRPDGQQFFSGARIDLGVSQLQIFQSVDDRRCYD